MLKTIIKNNTVTDESYICGLSISELQEVVNAWPKNDIITGESNMVMITTELNKIRPARNITPINRTVINDKISGDLLLGIATYS